MNKEQNISYSQPMLSSVDYDKLGVDLCSLTNLEYKAMQNCSEFLEKLEQVLLSTKMVQIPEMVVVHLCCYLGAIANTVELDSFINSSSILFTHDFCPSLKIKVKINCR